MKKINCLCVLIWITSCSYAQENWEDEITKSATAFYNSISTDQTSAALFEFKDVKRTTWTFLPNPHKGITFYDMSDEQAVKASQLIKDCLSNEGSQKALAIMQLEAVLKVVENRATEDKHRDPKRYYFAFYGKPSENQPWGWQIEGHHLSINYTSVAGKIATATPLFFGSNPARTKDGLEVLKTETDMGFTFLKSLTETQRKKAVTKSESPYEIVSLNAVKAELLMNEGISFNDLDKSQQRYLMEMVSFYVRRHPTGFADEFMRKIETAGLENLHFVWMGGDEWGKGHYYRIYNDVLLIEYDCTQNDANHIHTVVRDLTNDFGEDTLRLHYKNEH